MAGWGSTVWRAKEEKWGEREEQRPDKSRCACANAVSTQLRPKATVLHWSQYEQSGGGSLSP